MSDNILYARQSSNMPDLWILAHIPFGNPAINFAEPIYPKVRSCVFEQIICLI